MQRYQDRPLTEPETADGVSALYRKCAPALYAYLVQHALSVEDAEDILVEVFLAALENAQFASLPEKAQMAWLWRVAHNKTVDAYRRSIRRRNVAIESITERMMDDDESDPVQFTLQQEEYENLQLYLKRLSPLQQQVLQLRFHQGMRCSDIAVHLGKNEGAIKVMLSRALNFLRNAYKAGGEK